MSNYDEEGMYAYSRSVCDEVSEALLYTIFITPRHMRRRVTAVVMFICVCIYHEICCLSCLYMYGGQLHVYLDLSLKGLLLVNYGNGFFPATCS